MSQISGIALDQVVRHIHDLPSLPAVVAELLASMAQDDVDLHYLAGRLALDQALAAKTLRLANSSFYGMPSKVTSIQQAMSVLGLHSIRTLVTACGVIGALPRPLFATLDFKRFWRHAIATAVWARAGAPLAPTSRHRLHRRPAAQPRHAGAGDPLSRAVRQRAGLAQHA